MARAKIHFKEGLISNDCKNVAKYNLAESTNSTMKFKKTDVNLLIKEALNKIDYHLRCEHERSVSEDYIRGVKSHVKTLIRYYKIYRPTVEAGMKLIQQMVENKRAGNTIRLYVNALKVWASAEGIEIKLKSPKVTRRAKVYLTKLEVVELIKKGDSRSSCMAALMAMSGLRAKETVELRVNDINFKEKYIHVRDHGQGLKPHQERNVALTPECETFIKAWLEDRDRLCLELGLDNTTDYLFLTLDGQPIKRDYLYQLMARLGRKARLDKKTNSKILRTSFGTNGAMSGLETSVVQHSLGHADARTTLTFYIATVEEHCKQEVIKKLRYFE